MNKIIVLLALVAVALITWGIGEKLSSDALAMLIGMTFALIPAALILLFAVSVIDNGRREREHEREHRQRNDAQPQAPVIVITAQPQRAIEQQRQFRIVGEDESREVYSNLIDGEVTS